MKDVSEEEKEAVKLLKSMINHKPDNIRLNWRKGIYALQLILNLIEKQEKVIDLMAEGVLEASLYRLGICPAETDYGGIDYSLCKNYNNGEVNCYKCIKEHYYKEVLKDEQ